MERNRPRPSAKKVTTFNKQNLAQFRTDFAQAVKTLEQEYGIKLDLGSIGYDSSQFHTRMTATIVGDTNDVEKTKALLEIKKYGYMFGVKPEDYGKTFIFGGKIFTFIGIKPKSRKYPILGINEAGTTYKFMTNVTKAF